MHTAVHMMLKENLIYQTKLPSTIAFHGPVLMLKCPLKALLAVDRGQHELSDWSVVTQPHMEQAVMHCVLTSFYKSQH